MSSNIIECLQWRYATKKFDTKKKLSEEKLEVLKRSFNLTATSYGLQPLKMVIISDSELKRKLVSATMNQSQVAEASHVLVICTETEINEQYIKDYFKRIEYIRNTPRSILEPFESFLLNDISEKPIKEINVWMQKQAYIALGNLLTVCALEGIDSCPIEGFDPEKYDEILSLSELGLRSVLVLPVGYRAKDDLFADLKKVRRGVDEVIIEKN